MTGLWKDKQVGLELKMTLLQRDVLSILVWGSESWTLTSDVMRKLNGWASRCLAPITSNTIREEASTRTQSMCLTGVIWYRRMRYLGHELRGDPGDLTRRDILRFFHKTEVRHWFSGEGSILMDAPAANNSAMHNDNAGEVVSCRTDSRLAHVRGRAAVGTHALCLEQRRWIGSCLIGCSRSWASDSA
jgi:hypothetical protein